MLDDLSFPFNNSFADEMEGFFVPWQGDKVPDPQIVVLNIALAAELGLDPTVLNSAAGAAALSGAMAPAGASPLAMAYAGHQFGGFSAQLGDGRAILLGELIDTEGRRRDLHLKGSGRTPFSRGGDGKAVLGPVLREYLMGEAMHALGVPTTRALAAVTTGEEIARNGLEKGAVLARIAASHLRVGTFQFFAARGETEKLRKLADYAIARHFPDIVGREDRYLEFFRRVRDAQASLVARWVNIGFVHGVMNTDNTTISGETIDYGPCAFLDSYDPTTVFSSIDERGRYAYGNQPAIAQWNLARFAETLLDLIAPGDSESAVRLATAEIGRFPSAYRARWLEAMRAKLGLSDEDRDDGALVDDLFAAMAGESADFTCLFRALSAAVRGDCAPARAIFANPAAFDAWLPRWRIRIERQPGGAAVAAERMDATNPLYIPRNHKVEAALGAAIAGDLEPFERLLGLVVAPFAPAPGAEDFAAPPPAGTPRCVTFCGT